ncbi:phosphotransferase family protein [Halobium salinum]|uniref:Phosphotransferase family protein n=1 Tax=Halobium salinum TaxID=1364940 RepID=A0ABD5P935_9EURY|nr:phosphotransferase [Halobium salinum]
MDEPNGPADPVDAALGRAFPDRSVAEVGATGPSWNDSNRTVRVGFDDGRAAYLKLNVEGDGRRLARERAVLDYVGANADVSVPAVLDADTDGTIPYLVTEPVGRSFVRAWGDAGEARRERLARAMGRSLAGVHELRFDAHGTVVGRGDAVGAGRDGGPGLDLDRAPWTDVLVRTVEEMRAMAPSARFDDHFDRVVDAAETNRDLLNEAPAVLLHGDPAMPNCVLTDGGADGAVDSSAGADTDTTTTVGFLGWEMAHVGDPVRDLYRARDQGFDGLRDPAPEPGVDAFFDGYRERADGLPDGYEARRPVYEAVRHLGNSGYFPKLAEYVDEPEEELAAWVDAEMDRRLAAVT